MASTVSASVMNFDAVFSKIAKEKVSKYRIECVEIVRDAASSARAEVEERSPRRNRAKTKGKPYSKGWKMEERGETFIVHNVNKPQLARILNDGTSIRTTKRGYNRGKVVGDGHVTATYEHAKQKIEQKIKEL